MRTNKSVLRYALGACLFCVSFSACSENDLMAPIDTQKVTARQFGVTRDLVTMGEGETTRVSLAAATHATVWESADSGIATVEADGTVHGVAVGTTTITVTVDGMSTDVIVTVLPAVSEVSNNVR